MGKKNSSRVKKRARAKAAARSHRAENEGIESDSSQPQTAVSNGISSDTDVSEVAQSPVRGRRRGDSIASMSSTMSSSRYDYLAHPTDSGEIYSGPPSDAFPTSYSSYQHLNRRRSMSRSLSRSRGSLGDDSRRPSMSLSHRASNEVLQSPQFRPRAESTASFRFFDRDELELAEGSSTMEDEMPQESDEVAVEEVDDYHGGYRPSGRFRESLSLSRDDVYRRGSTFSTDDNTPLMRRESRDSYERPRRESGRSDDGGSYTFGLHDETPTGPPFPDATNTVQRFYIAEEDLLIGIAGYKTNRLKSVFFFLLYVATGGILFLIMRWFPRWRISCLGDPAPLGDCDWVVIENQWGEMEICDVHQARYNRALSTVFTLKPENAELATIHSGEEVESSSFMENDPDPILPVLRSISYRYIAFIYDPIEDIFRTNAGWTDPDWREMSIVKEGLSYDSFEDRVLAFGHNVLDIKEKSIQQLLVDEVLHPFYIFQVFSMILWAADTYYYYATCIFIISVISITNTLVETKSTMRRLSQMSRFICEVRVLRNGFWTTVDSSQLVPGDVYEISDPAMTLFPCDSVLLSGDCIVNESMLTGESVPVTKIPITSEGLVHLSQGSLIGSNVSPDIVRNFLFSGTRVIRVRRPQGGDSEDGPALAVVVRTGFSTTKGALVRSMMFPKPTGFKFYRDSFKYIGVMSGIACIGFIISTIDFIKMQLPTHLIVFRALDLITIVVPPALPATLTIGTNIALARLKKKQIYCIAPTRVNVGGKIDICCFDKTGTLTEDGLDIMGVTLAESNAGRRLFSDLHATTDDLFPHKSLKGNQAALDMLLTLATCHSLRAVDGELVGDPLDYKMFSFCNWSFEEEGFKFGEEVGSQTSNERMDNFAVAETISPSIVRPPPGRFSETGSDSEFGIIRSFEFVSQLRRMSVMVKTMHSRDVSVFVKGAPEVLPDICRPESFPSNYHELLHHYTHKGYRVIACATKTYSKLMWHKAQKLSREEVESQLDFLGFIVFENKLKPTTAGVIRQLENQAKIRTVMCTGDNVLTAISVARECEMVPSHEVQVFVPSFEESPEHETGLAIRWESVDNNNLTLNSATLRPLNPRVVPNYCLAVTGEVFRYLIDFGSDDILHQLLMRGKIYARMSPDEKHELVEKLQALDYTTCFCGDGANDCGALKAADVGISLSEAEASVAAPFTSRVFEISCVVDVIKEGRAALVTSFSCFKYMSLYSAIQFVTVGILYSSGSNLGDFQFLWIDMFLILPIAIFMAWSKPYHKLAPKRPNANLVSRKVLIPLIGEIAVLATAQFIVWSLVKKEPWHIAPIPGAEDADVASSDNTALFFVSCFEYILIAVALSVGPPYREDVYKNVPFVLCVIFLLGATAMLMSIQNMDSGLGKLMQLTAMPADFKLGIVAIGFVTFAVSWICESYVFTLLVRFSRALQKATGLGHKQYKNKMYKNINLGGV
ncbi:Vacuolar protein with a possible role in sequestering heavy metals, putative [Yarrowia lipolytica]|nr:Vacuolar protein with a possible role in sequestering heavy metals, putative [Yarrowia lipolytica]